MATRIYLPNTGAAPITPAFGTWTETTGADVLWAVLTRISSAMTSKTRAHTATAANSTYLSRQYIFGPLAAQTIPASTIKGTIRVLESAANDNLNAMRLLVRVVSADGSTYRSPVLYGPTNSTVAEFNTALRAKRLATGGATASVVVTAGDYLVIEIGTTTTVGGTSPSDSISYGDDSATDLGDNETDTAANNPFVEIATDLALAKSALDAGAATDAATPAASYTSTETGVATDGNAVVSVPIAATDAGVGIDSPAVQLALPTATETGVGGDAVDSIALATLADAGAGAETATVDTGSVAKSAVDAGTGADAAALTSAPVSADAAAATDSLIGIAQASADVGAATDTTGALATALGATDAGAGSDLAASIALAVLNDAGAGTDTAESPAVVLPSTEAGLAADAAIPAAALASVEAGTASDTATVDAGAVMVSASDSGAASEAAAIAALYAAADTGVGAELAALSAGYIATDSAIGVDTAGLAALIAALGGASSAEVAALTGSDLPGTVGVSAALLGSVGAAALGTSLGATVSFALVGATAAPDASVGMSVTIRDHVGAEHG